MFRDYLQTIEGIEIFPIIGLILFLSVFILIVIWVLTIDKKYLQKMKELPFDSDVKKVSNFTGEQNEN